MEGLVRAGLGWAGRGWAKVVGAGVRRGIMGRKLKDMARLMKETKEVERDEYETIERDDGTEERDTETGRDDGVLLRGSDVVQARNNKQIGYWDGRTR
ncbi:hypothetical protein E2C01_093318 [Portunus trituberculatus]|uniref:Uncharacterized protein n=1 Tax=Portunus trituberculatus TaxID=210409 RepID=A0A5B7JIP3_PORTR|nr:hypothetical protein [Portunus trituberculatus]